MFATNKCNSHVETLCILLEWEWICCVLFDATECFSNWSANRSGMICCNMISSWISIQRQDLSSVADFGNQNMVWISYGKTFPAEGYAILSIRIEHAAIFLVMNFWSFCQQQNWTWLFFSVLVLPLPLLPSRSPVRWKLNLPLGFLSLKICNRIALKFFALGSFELMSSDFHQLNAVSLQNGENLRDGIFTQNQWIPEPNQTYRGGFFIFFYT